MDFEELRSRVRLPYSLKFMRRLREWADAAPSHDRMGLDRLEMLSILDRLAHYEKALRYYADHKHLLTDPERSAGVVWGAPGYISFPYIAGAEMGFVARQALKSMEEP